MGLDGKDEGVFSHVIDLVVGGVAAALAWALYLKTDQAIWSLLLLLAAVAGMIWWRTRGAHDNAEPPD